MRLLFLFLAISVGGSALAQSQQKEPEQQEKRAEKAEKTESFGEFVEKVGKSVWNRLNERFNLESAGKNLIDKKDKILSPLRNKDELPNSKTPEEKPDQPEPKPKSDG